MLSPIAVSTSAEPVPLIMRQFLAWIAARPRSYAETMEAWRTSCPRLSAWEDALGDGLVEVDTEGVAGFSSGKVRLTETGKAAIADVA